MALFILPHFIITPLLNNTLLLILPQPLTCLPSAVMSFTRPWLNLSTTCTTCHTRPTVLYIINLHPIHTIRTKIRATRTNPMLLIHICARQTPLHTTRLLRTTTLPTHHRNHKDFNMMVGVVEAEEEVAE